MSRHDDPRCPYVKNEKSSVFCGEYRVAPESCLRCGWNPVEHERRAKLLRAGVVKSFLNIDLNRIREKYDGGDENV